MILKKTTFIVLAVMCMAGIFWLGYCTAGRWSEKWQTQPTEEATVLVEKIRLVTRLITVEGFFSEIYDYKDYYGYDLAPFRKKALIRVKAKVSVGYDLEKIKITTLPDRKVIVISEIPPPELLSIEHDLDYYDIQEGVFNSFSREELNELNARAKEFVRQKAQESQLFDEALLKKNKLFDMIRLLVKGAGWQLEIEREADRLGEDLPDG